MRTDAVRRVFTAACVDQLWLHRVVLPRSRRVRAAFAPRADAARPPQVLLFCMSEQLASWVPHLYRGATEKDVRKGRVASVDDGLGQVSCAATAVHAVA